MVEVIDGPQNNLLHSLRSFVNYSNSFLSICLSLFFFLDCPLPKCESKLDGPGQTSGWSDWHFAFRNETVDRVCWTDYLMSIQITSHRHKEFQCWKVTWDLRNGSHLLWSAHSRSTITLGGRDELKTIVQAFWERIGRHWSKIISNLCSKKFVEIQPQLCLHPPSVNS